MQDEKLDFQSKLEDNESKEHFFKEEIIKLKDSIEGKDLAIT